LHPTATGPSRRFLVLHGWENHRPRDHWQWQLVETLRASGEQKKDLVPPTARGLAAGP
jgi:hypothetical protein